ncbi:MAG: hypothetical protein ABSE53_02365 [Terracidiphilus sp.]|jgi:hypothetical protein
MAKSPEKWLMNAEMQAARRAAAASSVKEHRSASKSVCADAAKHRPIGKALDGCEGLNENGEML